MRQGAGLIMACGIRSGCLLNVVLGKETQRHGAKLSCTGRKAESHCFKTNCPQGPNVPHDSNGIKQAACLVNKNTQWAENTHIFY